MNRNAIHKRAQRAVSINGLSCQICSSTENLHRHHHDYSKPIDVQIICQKCHGRQHALERWKNHIKEKICPICTNTFTYERARQKTCSKVCAHKLSWVSRGGRKSQILAEL